MASFNSRGGGGRSPSGGDSHGISDPANGRGLPGASSHKKGTEAKVKRGGVGIHDGSGGSREKTSDGVELRSGVCGGSDHIG